MDLELFPHEDNWFSLYLNGQPAADFENIRLIVKNSAGRRIVGLQVRHADGSIYSSPMGCEYQIPNEPPIEWVRRVGRYSVVNPDPHMLFDTHVLIQTLPSGAMYYSIPNFSANILDPIYEDEAIRTGLGRNVNETIQVVDCDPGECLQHLGYLIKKQPITDIPPRTREIYGASDLQKKGKEMERKLLQRFRFPGICH